MSLRDLPTLGQMHASPRAMPKSAIESRVDVALEKQATEAKQLREWTKAVDSRDRRICRACGKHSDPDRAGLTTRGHRHHIVYRSAGGTDAPCNRVTLCASCHNDEHHDRLRFTNDSLGYDRVDADHGMTFWRKDEAGFWYISREETEPGQVRKD